MAEVSLRAYCDEVQEMINNDACDQAIAICQHILRHYPKHIESYRLLGRACLEKGDYPQAAEFFKRALSADPEDFIARVGLSIVYEDGGALEEAIWQLERAFELNPGNPEVRSELRRLYGRRDGLEPPKIPLTPGALGRLYLKGGLYQQAIGEFRRLLSQDSDMIDAQVALAEALWQAGQRLEAAQVCLDILEKLPYCLKANLILGEIWINSERVEEGQERLRIAQALDPENAIAQSMMGDRSPLPAKEVLIPRLAEEELEKLAPPVREIVPVGEEAAPPSAVPGVAEEELPEWLRILREEGAVTAIEEEIPVEEEIPPVAEVPPMAPPPAPTPPTPAPPLELAPEEEGEEEEMPEWLRQLRAEAPLERPVTPVSEEALPEGEEAVPDWLQQVRMAMGEEPLAPEEGVEEPVVEREAPPWLEEVGGVDLEEAVTGVLPLEEVFPAEAEEEEVGEEEAAAVPDWLQRLREGMAPEEEVREEAAPPEAPEEEEIPEWLREARVEPETPPVVTEEAAPAPPTEEVPEWLQALEEEVTEEMPPAKEVAEEEAEEVPAWLRRLEEPVAEEPAAIEAPEEMAPPVVEAPPEVVAEAPAVEMPEEVAPPVMEAPPEVVAEAPAEEVEEEEPAWMRILREEGYEVPTLEEEAEVAEVAAPEIEAVEIPEEVAPPVAEAPPEVVAEAPAVEIPEEVAPPVVEAPPEVVAEAPVEEVEEEEPAWVRILREEGYEVPTLEEEAEVAEVAAPEEAIEAVEIPEEVTPPVVEAPPEVVAEAPAEEVPVVERVLEVPPVPLAVPEEELVLPPAIAEGLARLRANPNDHATRLEVARAYIQEGDLDSALEHYERLIRAGAYRDQVIADLEAAVAAYPSHHAVQRLLGDAYMKDGQLQKALDAYREALAKL